MVEMDSKTSVGPNGHQFGLSGDSTNGGGISRLAEITALDPNFMKLIGATTTIQNSTTTTTTTNNNNNSKARSKNGPPAPPPSVESSVKRNPEDIAKQMQAVSEKRRPLLSSQETIESYKSQVLELKLKLHQLKQAQGRELENFNVDDERQDLIAELMNQNASLRRQLEEIRQKKEERMTKNTKCCQTNLDLINMEELLKASITLKRQKEQELHNIQNQITSHQQQQQQYQQHHQERINQINYATISNKQLAPDEKELLESLYKVDGWMTTILDKLKAISNTH